MAEGRSYRVRIAGQELQVPDLETLLRLAREGQLGGSAEVCAPASDRWIPVAQLLAAHGPRRDPWSVWEAAEQVDARSIWEEFAPPPSAAAPPPTRAKPGDVEELPPTALTNMPLPEEEPTDPGRPAPRPASSRGATVPPAPPRPPQKKPGPLVEAVIHPPEPPRRQIEEIVRRPAGKVIAFPPRSGPSPRPMVDGPYALEVEEPVPLRPPPPPTRSAPTLPPDPEPDTSVRWWRLATLLLVGLLVLGVARWYYITEAVQTYATPATRTAPVAVVQSKGATHSANASPYAPVEEQLRALLPTDTKEVRTDSALEDALLVELRAMRVDVLKIEAPVLSWTGRKNDVPQRTQIRIHLREDPDNLDWDLGAVGMVVGKYIERYTLEVQVLDVLFEGGDDTPARIAITPESARQLYMERKSLLDFLKTR